MAQSSLVCIFECVIVHMCESVNHTHKSARTNWSHKIQVIKATITQQTGNTQKKTDLFRCGQLIHICEVCLSALQL